MVATGVFIIIGFVVSLIPIGLMIYLLILFGRLVKATEKIANNM